MERFGCALLALVLTSFQPLDAQIQGQWATTGSMQAAREFNAQVKLSSGKVLSMGGADNNGNILSSSELYNSSSGKWALTGSMLTARELFPAVLLKGGKVLVTGGLGTGSTVLATAELYDPTSGIWSSAGSLSVPRFGHTATLLSSGKVLVTGGCGGNPCSDTAVSEIYDPTLNTWSTTGSLGTARAYHTAVALKTGKVLVIGGNASGTVTTSCELYDSTKGTWSAAASTTTARYLNSATLLSDGKVLAAGGTPSRAPVSTAELYDPTANTWTATGNMTIGRYAHTAALLPDGTVLVAGGIGQSISCGKDCTSYIPTNKADIFTESTATFAATANLSQSLAYQSMTMLGSGRALENAGSATTSICCTVQNTASIYTPLTLTFSSTSLNFGLLQIGLTSASQIVTITNVSSHTVSFTSITSSGDFSETTTCPTTTTLNAGQSCTVTVSFTPTKSGTRSGAVTLKDSSPGSPSQTISLTGTGETLALGFSPSSLNLGSVVVGSSITMTATMTNDGSSSVNITGTSISPADGTFTQTNNCPATLAVQQTCTFTVVFTPPDVFTYNATLSVTNSAGAAATLALTGTGLNN